MAVDILAGPAIWSATEAESAWHDRITLTWTHDGGCAQCTRAVALETFDFCPTGLALREAETVAYRATKTDQYVPLALAEVAS